MLKPGRSNTYSALSALAGHYNSFGPETPVPKKRLERITKVVFGPCWLSMWVPLG